MASMSTVRAGLALRAEAITGLNGYARPTGTLNLPAVLILPRPGVPIEFDETMGRGSDTLFFDVPVLVADTVGDLAQRKLDSFLDGSGSTSLKQALESDDIAIAGVDFVFVPRLSNYGDVEYSGKLYFGATFQVEVNADGA